MLESLAKMAGASVVHVLDTAVADVTTAGGVRTCAPDGPGIT
jgi:hypothetical protein